MTHTDLAEAAIALAEVGRPDGVTPAPTGPEAVDLDGIAALASELTSRPIRRVVVPDDDYRVGLLARGIPAQQATMLLGVFQASRQGAFAPANPSLARLLGRPPLPVRDVLAAALAAAR